MKTQTVKMTQRFAAVALAVSASFSLAQAAQVSPEKCQANLKADLKEAVAATIRQDGNGLKTITDFRYSAVESDGGSEPSITYVFTGVYPQNKLLLVGHVAVTPECRIAGGEKFFGLMYTTVATPLK